MPAESITADITNTAMAAMAEEDLARKRKPAVD